MIAYNFTMDYYSFRFLYACSLNSVQVLKIVTSQNKDTARPVLMCVQRMVIFTHPTPNRQGVNAAFVIPIFIYTCTSPMLKYLDFAT